MAGIIFMGAGRFAVISGTNLNSGRIGNGRYSADVSGHIGGHAVQKLSQVGRGVGKLGLDAGVVSKLAVRRDGRRGCRRGCRRGRRHRGRAQADELRVDGV